MMVSGDIDLYRFCCRSRESSSSECLPYLCTVLRLNALFHAKPHENESEREK
jgi:hypothetical protein